MDFDKAVAELEALVETLEREGDERGLLLLELVDAIHRPAFERIAAGVPDAPEVRAMLAMYGAGEVEPRDLVEEGLDQIRPYIHSHGGEVELVGVEDGVVRVRLSGACHGCAASAMTLRRGIESALRESYPALREVIAEEPEGPPGGRLIQLEGIEDLRRPRFVEVDAATLLPGAMQSARVEDVDVLLANVDGEVYAFRDACAVDGAALHGGRLADTVIVCPWHNCAYDARTGARLDEPDEPGLAVVPVAPSDAGVRVAVNVL